MKENEKSANRETVDNGKSVDISKCHVKNHSKKLSNDTNEGIREF